MRVALWFTKRSCSRSGIPCLADPLTLVLFRIDVVRDHVNVIGVAESLASFSTSAVLPEPTGPVHVCFSV